MPVMLDQVSRRGAGNEDRFPVGQLAYPIATRGQPQDPNRRSPQRFAPGLPGPLARRAGLRRSQRDGGPAGQLILGQGGRDGQIASTRSERTVRRE